MYWELDRHTLIEANGGRLTCFAVSFGAIRMGKRVDLVKLLNILTTNALLIAIKAATFQVIPYFFNKCGRS